MKKLFGFLISVFFVFGLSACNSGNLDRSRVISAPKDYELTILFLNDTNGQIEGGINTGMGYSRYSTILERARKEFGRENVLYFEAGDTFTGSVMAEADKGESVVKILNALELDAVTFGKNDFSYEENYIKSLEFKANFKILGANVKTQKGQDLFIPYIIKEVKGVKIGIFGLVTPEIYNSEKVDENIIVEEPILSASKVVEELKSQGAEFIIVLSSLGMNNINAEWQSSTVAEAVPDIDLIIDGNSMVPLEEKLLINGTTIVSAGENLMNVGVLKIDFDASKRDEERIFYKLIKKSDVVISEDEPLPEKTEIKTAVPRFITHTVVKGDTLYSLAKRYGTTVDEIAFLNPSIVNGQINIGQTYIMVSDKEKKNRAVSAQNSSPQYVEHTVVKGDTLYSLAKRYGITVEEAVDLNPEITDGQTINIGQTYKFSVKNQPAVETLSTEQAPKYRISIPTGIAKDSKIEELIAKIKTAQSFMSK